MTEDPDSNVVFLVFTDVVGSTSLDENNRDPIGWRVASFTKQLQKILSVSNSLALKSIGDALFILITPKEEDEIGRCKEILAKTFQAFEYVQKAKPKKIPIRAVVHKITGHKTGEKIAKAIRDDKNIDNNQSMLLTESLKKDIFGEEVNKAARIQSLVKGAAILVSEEIAKIIEGVNYDNRLANHEDIEFEDEGKNYYLHSPVPGIYLKGLKKIKYDEPIIVWQLGNEKHREAVLAKEFKSFQSFRLLLTGVRGIRFEYNNLDSLIKEEIEQLQIESNFTKRFYTDLLWKVFDWFEIKKNYFKRTKGTNDNFKINTQGQFHHLIIDKANGKYKITLKEQTNSDSDLIVPIITFTSFPSLEVSVKGRKLLESETQTGLIDYVEPQSLHIYEQIKITKDYPREKLRDDNIKKLFSGGFTLLFFGIYAKYLMEADKSDKIFLRVNDLELTDHLSALLHGLMSGLVDGFVLYKLDSSSNNKKNDFEKSIKTLIERYACQSSKRGIDFYEKTYPISIFLLETIDEFQVLKRNIKYLNLFNWNKKIN